MLKLLKLGLAIAVLPLFLMGCGSENSATSELLPEKGQPKSNSQSIELAKSSLVQAPIQKLQPIVGYTQLPSKAHLFFKVVDDDEQPVTDLAEKRSDLWKDHFTVNYSDGSLMDSESSTNIRPATNLLLPTVIAIDISSSIDNTSFTETVTGVRDALLDTSGAVPKSLLLPNQLVSLFVFDSEVTEMNKLTRDPVYLNSLFDEILAPNFRMNRGSSNSTDLHGAAKKAIEISFNAVTDDVTTLGTAIIISDGDENANVYSLDAVSSLRDASAQRVFTLSKLSGEKPWQQLASKPEYAIVMDEQEVLEETLLNVFEIINTSLDGYYVLEHSAASLEGIQELQIDYVDSSLTTHAIKFQYDTTDFTGSIPELKIETEISQHVSDGFPEVDINATSQVYFNKLDESFSFDWYLNDVLVESGSDQLSYTANSEGIYRIKLSADRSTSNTIYDHTWITYAPSQLSSTQAIQFLESNVVILGWDILIIGNTDTYNEISWSVDSFSADGTSLDDGCLLTASADFDVMTLLFVEDEAAYCVINASDNNGLIAATYVHFPSLKWVYSISYESEQSTTNSVIDFDSIGSDPHSLTDQWTLYSTASAWPDKLDSYVLKSPMITHKQSTSLLFSASFSTLVFDFLTRSELGYDFLEVYIDEKLVWWYSGNMGNTWRTTGDISVPVGVHDVQIKYRKDASISEQVDSVFIDNLIYH